jgi:hypothetical protein
MFSSILRRNKGTALIEFCFILPILVIMVLFVIDFGRLIQARLIVTNVAREGGNLASRGWKTGTDLFTILQSSTTPLNLQGGDGRIYVSSIEAAQSEDDLPSISSQDNDGNLGVDSGIYEGEPMGLTQELYGHLVFNVQNQAPDINRVTVVEIFYLYRPITPLPRFIVNIFLTPGYSGIIVGSRSVYCTTSTGG